MRILYWIPVGATDVVDTVVSDLVLDVVVVSGGGDGREGGFCAVREGKSNLFEMTSIVLLSATVTTYEALFEPFVPL